MAQANVIEVTTPTMAIAAEGECSLIEALENANDTTTGQPHTDCAAGDTDAAVEDMIILKAETYTLTAAHNYWYGPNGFPPIISKIRIPGNGAIIERDPHIKQRLRLFYIAGLTPALLPEGC
jgi:hypothetical protein